VKQYLVDVPVCLTIFIRPDCLKQQFEIVRKARPSILFIASDGPRNDVPSDREKILASRKIVEKVDWECEVHRLYFEDNQGIYNMGMYKRKYIFDKVDRCIFLEDDDIPAVSFFRFCAELLERYKDDLRVQGISGFNPLNKYNGPNTDYFFSGEKNSWGSAYWKRTYDLYDSQLEYIKDNYVLNRLKEQLPKQTYEKVLLCGKTGMVNGHLPGSEFLNGINRVLQNSLYIMPTNNLISNIGCTNDGTHSHEYKTLSKVEQRLFCSAVYELEFPLKHPKYVIRDFEFEHKIRRLNGVGYPYIVLYRRIIKTIKILKHQGIEGLMHKVEKHKRNKYER
jgi:hypothetical protein